MSYAIETKKRKFERILESLTDGSASQPRTSLNSRNNASTAAPSDTASDASKRRRITPTSVSKCASTSSLTGHYLPSSRPVFLERLETYRQVTKWHVPSTEPVNASIWAKRGWICVVTDTVLCGSCKERLKVDLDVAGRANADGPQESTDDDFSLSKDIYDGLVKRYQELVVTAHADSCPWRKRGCDGSIQRIEGLLNVSNAISAMTARYQSLMPGAETIPSVVQLPEVKETAFENLRLEDHPGKSRNLNLLRLAICGWQQKTDDVIECRHCFRSLGMWLYRGDEPTMEHLDAVESHLEYCPWRSPEAQDTELTSSYTSVQKKEKFPGWQLVHQALVKDNLKRQSSSTSTRTIDLQEAEASRPFSSDSMTPEQKERKRLDLMRRIKDLKKPFTMKSLLGKKNTAQK